MTIDNFKKNLASSLQTYEVYIKKSNIDLIKADYIEFKAKAKADPTFLENLKAQFLNTHPKPLTPEEAKIVEPFILTPY